MKHRMLLSSCTDRPLRQGQDPKNGSAGVSWLVRGGLTRLAWLPLCCVLSTCLAAQELPRRELPGSDGWKVIKETDNHTQWLEQPGNYLMITDHPGNPAFPLDDVDRLRAAVRQQAAKEKGGLIEAELVERDGKRVAYFVTKDTYKNVRGYRYVGRCIIPLESGWREVRMDTLPIGTTGLRESTLAVRLNLYANTEMESIPADAPPTPGPSAGNRDGSTPKRIKGWFFDPYDKQFDTAANYTKTDHADYDSMFPKHSLSRLRTRFPEILGIESVSPQASDAIESATLKQAMIDVTVKMLQERMPKIEMDRVRRSVERAIATFRSTDKTFLLVSKEDEKRLQRGEKLESSLKRIDDAKRFLSEFEIRVSGPTVKMLQEHEAGNLSEVHTELLAQLLSAQVSKARAALEN